MDDRYAKLRAAQQSIGVSDWQWWDSNSFRRLTFIEANGRHGQDGGALCAVVQPSDGHPDVQMASGVREFIEACSPDTIRALLADFDEASARAFYETSVAQAAIEQVKVLEAERDRLRDALDAAQKSLNTIATLGGSKEDFMGTMRQVRGYANSRARVARAALAQEQGESDGV